MAQKNKARKMLTNNVAAIAQALVSVNLPGKVITDPINAAVKVGEGNILRIQTSGDLFVAFSDESSIGVVSAATTPAVKLVGAGVHYVVCQSTYVRASGTATRVELLEF